MSEKRKKKSSFRTFPIKTGQGPLLNAKRFTTFYTNRLLLSEPSSSRHLKRKGVLSNPQSTSLGYSIVQFRRGFSDSSYDLQFNHKVPIYSLKQMVSAGKLEYDYPVYWSKSDERIDTAGTPLTRRLKKDKVLKDLSDKYARLFDLIKTEMKNSFLTEFAIFFLAIFISRSTSSKRVNKRFFSLSFFFKRTSNLLSLSFNFCNLVLPVPLDELEKLLVPPEEERLERNPSEVLENLLVPNTFPTFDSHL